ncbi:hypothetical protein OS493_039619 [Desmophyllum pertusum]|uniref:Uncharacterized protein n=1 Tax=Desmophyllum pertusum TaxID=174260 RepID=A0A9X0CIP9_9CNID|nr:hypothetical protein OS493_039619 [Desmophyllum pertusum]
MRSNVLGDHKDTAQSYYWLGTSQCSLNLLNGLAKAFIPKELFITTWDLFITNMGNYPSAIEALQKASDVRSNLLGDHKDTAQSYHWLGKAKHNKRDLDGALESLQKASQMRKEVFRGSPQHS